MNTIKITLALILLQTAIWADIYTDNTTGLQWQTNPSTSKYTWQQAKSYCDNLTYAKKNDWRLPHIDALMSLTDKTKYNPAITTNKIKIKSDGYWSSTQGVSDTSEAWLVYFEYGSDGWYSQSNKYYALCVRDSI